jgi:hypothetical protein
VPGDTIPRFSLSIIFVEGFFPGFIAWGREVIELRKRVAKADQAVTRMKEHYKKLRRLGASHADIVKALDEAFGI